MLASVCVAVCLLAESSAGGIFSAGNTGNALNGQWKNALPPAPGAAAYVPGSASGKVQELRWPGAARIAAEAATDRFVLSGKAGNLMSWQRVSKKVLTSQGHPEEI